MDNLIASPFYSPLVFFTALFVLLVILTVSVARLIERFGITLPNLAAHSPLARNSINVLLAIAWLYLTYVAFALTFSFGFIALFFGGEMLFYALSVILIYTSLSVLTFIWLRGGLHSAALMIAVIISTSTYVLISKPGWVCKPLAESGFSMAYVCLARAYELPGNKGLMPDPTKALYWYKQAVMSGNAKAAMILSRKTSIPAAERYEYMKKAAEAGNIDAAYQYAKAIKYSKSAIHWLTFAADRGHPHALYDLGERYYYGNGVERDIEKTRKLWKKATKAGSLNAKSKLDNNFLEQPLPEQLERMSTIDHLRIQASESNVDSQYQLAHMLLLSGNTPEHELEEGRRWLVVAAERNHEQALREIIDAHEYGKYGFPVDLHKSRLFSERLLRTLAKNSNTSINRSKRQFAYYRNQSIREKIDTNVRKQSIKELTAPAEAGDANAQFQLAHLLMINHKREESIRWREKAAENGHADAQYLEARRIMYSALQKKYADKALDYYRSASKQNHPGALAALGDIYRSGNRRMKIQKNLYVAKVYYRKTLAQTRGDTVYNHTFGSPGRTTFIPAKYIRKYLDELPDAIKRLDLEGLSPQQKETKIKDWYYHEIEQLEPGGKSADKLKLLNQQRDVLLKNLQKS